MEIRRNEFIPIIEMLEKLYVILANENATENEMKQHILIAEKVCNQLFLLCQGEKNFIKLYEYIRKIASEKGNVRVNRYELLHLLEQFELSLLEKKRFHLYFENEIMEEIPLNSENVQTITKLPVQSIQRSPKDFSVYVAPRGSAEKIKEQMDFHVDLETVLIAIKHKKPIDYYAYDRLYLEAKLNSLKKRQDIKLLLAGSSYTMCGLFEKDMPLPSRNIAINSQDLYYSIQSIERALSYNPSITHCILSFAYYVWGQDLSHPYSKDKHGRIADVNYPVFGDKHNFVEEIKERKNRMMATVTPLEKHLLSLGTVSDTILENYKLQLEENHYFPYPRVGSEVVKNTEEVNAQLAKKRAESHNRFLHYPLTVQENQEIFQAFLQKMKEKGVNVIIYVPPVTKHYRTHIEPQLIANFYTYMKPFQEKFSFTFIDLFDSKEFGNEDFFDYDHLNDQGAKKLGELLGNELKKL